MVRPARCPNSALFSAPFSRQSPLFAKPENPAPMLGFPSETRRNVGKVCEAGFPPPRSGESSFRSREGNLGRVNHRAGSPFFLFRRGPRGWSPRFLRQRSEASGLVRRYDLYRGAFGHWWQCSIREQPRHVSLAFGDALDLNRGRFDDLLNSIESLRRRVFTVLGFLAQKSFRPEPHRACGQHKSRPSQTA